MGAANARDPVPEALASTWRSGFSFFLCPGRIPPEEEDKAVVVTDTNTQGTSLLVQVSNVLVALHKTQFGRGPTQARSHFAGPDALICVLEDALLPAERKLIELGDHGRVRDSRTAYQAATADEFIAAVEEIVHRKVRAFASAVDTSAGTVFENFAFEPEGSDGSGDGSLSRKPALRS